MDGGDAYTPAPAWVPFRRQVGYWVCVIVGRWIGGMLGYRPFFKEYTTDWDFAVAKMNGSYFQRHLVNQAYCTGKSWSGQVQLSSGDKPTNAEFEQWTVNLDINATEQKANGIVNTAAELRTDDSGPQKTTKRDFEAQSVGDSSGERRRRIG